MRFVDTNTLQFREVSDSEITTLNGRYAILSHRWTKEEISYQEMLEQEPQLQLKQGYAKLKGACKVAKNFGYNMIWIDTCCINKDSSTELSEAIRSMYRWYANAAVCIAYLEDVLYPDGMANSEWFNRGWTLQELIAPAVVKFFGCEWDHIGDKSALVDKLSNITRVPPDVLRDPAKMRQCSVAQRMSWAAGRVTTRPEDIAYSLVGLFNVSLHTEYGEREQAFVRLQEAIAQKWADESIFAWNMDDTKKDRKYCGLFATSPNEFRYCGHYVSRNASEGFSVGNTGVKVSFLTLPYSMGIYSALLDVEDQSNGSTLAILLSRLDTEGQYTRVCDSRGIDLLNVTGPTRSYTRRSMSIHQESMETAKEVFPGFWLRTLTPPGHDAASITILSRDNRAEEDRLAVPEGTRNIAGIVMILPTKQSSTRTWSQIRSMIFGFDDEFNPICQVANRVWNEEERVALSSKDRSEDREFLFSRRWIETEGEWPSLEHKWPAGFRLLQGNKDGLNRVLPALNLKISFKRCPDQSPGASVSGRDVWTVDVTEIEPGRSPERENQRYWCEQWMCCILSTLPAFTGCLCCALKWKNGNTERGGMECCC